MPLQRTESSASLTSLLSTASTSSSTSKTNKLRRHARQSRPSTLNTSSLPLSMGSATFSTTPSSTSEVSPSLPTTPGGRRPSLLHRQPSSPAISQNDAEWLAGMMELLDDMEKDAKAPKECRLKNSDVVSDVVSSAIAGMGKWMMERWFPGHMW